MDHSPAVHMGRADLVRATGEEPVDVVAGVGATLVVTPTRVAIVRYGANLRPRSGLRAWTHGTVDVRLESPKHGSGRVALRTAGAATPREIASVFIGAEDWQDAERVAAAIRRASVRSRTTDSPDAAAPNSVARRGPDTFAPKP
jgi:hypothetical protein